jgi:hypothetical protein
MTERLTDLRKAAKLVAEGKSDQEIAVALGLSAAQIKRWRQNNPRFQRNVSLRRSDPAGAATMDMLAEVGEELEKREFESPESESSAPDDDIPPVTDAGASLTMPQRVAIDAQDFKKIGVMGGRSGPVSDIAFSADGRSLVAGGSDSTVRVSGYSTSRAGARSWCYADIAISSRESPSQPMGNASCRRARTARSRCGRWSCRTCSASRTTT